MGYDMNRHTLIHCLRTNHSLSFPHCPGVITLVPVTKNVDVLLQIRLFAYQSLFRRRKLQRAQHYESVVDNRDSVDRKS